MHHKGLWYLLQLGVLFRLIKDFPHSHKHWQHESRSQHDEDPTDVLHPQSTGLFAVLLWTAIPSPPLLLHHVQLPFLLQLEDGDGDLVSVWRACEEKNTTWASGTRITARYDKKMHAKSLLRGNISVGGCMKHTPACMWSYNLSCYCWLLRGSFFVSPS